MKTINDLKDKLSEIIREKMKIDAAKKAVEKAEDNFYDISWKLFAKAREIINNIVEKACCQEILDIKWISREKLYIAYKYCCGDNEGIDHAEFPPKYFFMGEDEYIADAEVQKTVEEKAKKKAKQCKKDNEEHELYLKLKAKYEQKT